MDALLFDENDIINLAITNLMMRPVVSEHGPYCVRCALAAAKGELETQHNIGLSWGMTLYDLALVTAAERVEAFTECSDKDKAIAALEAAIHT